MGQYKLSTYEFGIYKVRVWRQHYVNNPRTWVEQMGTGQAPIDDSTAITMKTN